MQSAIALLFLTAACFFAYFPGLNGPFLLDDFHNLEQIAVLGGIESYPDALRYIFGNSGTDIYLSTSRASFLLNAQDWPAHPFTFKLTNVLIHCFNSVLVFLMVDKLAILTNQPKARLLALLVTTSWLLMPMHVTSVLYVVQRMALLGATFSLLSIVAYLNYCQKKNFIFVLSSAAFALVAVVSKANSAVLLLLIPLLSYFITKRATLKQQAVISLLLKIAPVLFCAAFLYALFSRYDHYSGREFTLIDRLLSQSSILFEYVSLSFSPLANFTVFHDDKEFLLQQSSTLFSAALWLVHLSLIFWGVRLVKRGNLLGVAILWFYACHSVESTVMPLELMFEHRNYMPSIGLMLAAALALFKLSGKLRKIDINCGVRIAISLFLPMLYLTGLIYHANLWSDYRNLASKWTYENPTSIRSHLYFNSMLENSGLEQLALNTLREKNKLFDTPQLKLQEVILRCKVEQLPTIVDLDNLSLQNFNSGMLYELKRISNLSGEDCIKASFPGGIMKLAEAIEQMPLLQEKRSYYAQFLDISANIYIQHGDYTSALINREKAWMLQPSIPTALKVAELALAGGNPELAQSFIQQAQRLDTLRWYRDQKVEKQISNLSNALTVLKRD